MKIEIGPHTLYQGDALAVLRDLEDGSADLLFTDAPYSSGGQFRGDRTGGTGRKYLKNAQNADFAGDTRDQRAHGYWCALWLSECLRVTKPGSLAFVFTDWRQLATTIDAFQAGGFVFRGVLPWVKPGVRPQKGRPTQSCEFLIWGSNGPIPRPGPEAICAPGFVEAMVPRHKLHQTEKPVEVIRPFLQLVPPGATVLDPFMGSGSTLVAAQPKGVRGIGVELSPVIFGQACKRLRDTVAQLGMFPTQLEMEGVA